MSFKNRPRKTMRKLNGRSKGKQCRVPAFGWGIRGGVNKESACLVEDFQPTRYELEVLASHYLDRARQREFFWAFLKQVGGSQIWERLFAYRRLDTIEKVLGKKTFQEAIAATEEKWERRFAEASEIERNPKPCKHCGLKKIDFYTQADPHIPEGYCSPECARRARDKRRNRSRRSRRGSCR